MKSTTETDDDTKSECGFVSTLMSQESTRPLTDAENANIETHAARCAGCRDAIAGRSAADTAISRMLALPTGALPSREEWARIDQRIAKEPLPEARDSARPAGSILPLPGIRRRILARALSIAALLLLSLFVFELLRDNATAPESESAIRTAFASEVEVLEMPEGTTCMIVTPEVDGDAVLVLFGSG